MIRIEYKFYMKWMLASHNIAKCLSFKQLDSNTFNITLGYSYNFVQMNWLAQTVSGRNIGQNQKLVSRFFENQTFCRLLIAVSLKMYSKFG